MKERPSRSPHWQQATASIMKFIGISIFIFLKILYTENRMLPINHYVTIDPNHYEPTSVHISPQAVENMENPHEKVIGLGESYDEKDNEEYFDYDRPGERTKKPCAIVVLSNMQNPNMQSLLRKYKYDSNGVLIPSSVKYFIKMPQGLRASPVLVPLNDDAFSPLGGFVRYYKEVPPIPHSW